jgi:hypothetical protein
MITLLDYKKHLAVAIIHNCYHDKKKSTNKNKIPRKQWNINYKISVMIISIYFSQYMNAVALEVILIYIEKNCNDSSINYTFVIRNWTKKEEKIEKVKRSLTYFFQLYTTCHAFSLIVK